MILAPEFFVDCHNHTEHSNYRLRDCINKVDNLIDYAIELGHNGVAITDHETIGGFLMAQKHYQKRLKNAATDEEKERIKNFRLILGNEIYLCRDGLNKDNFIKGEDKYYHFILLAKDEIGNKQLRQLSTRAWNNSFETARMTRVPTYYSDLKEIIGANPGHVIASSACLGSWIDGWILKHRAEIKADTPEWNGEFWNELYSWIENIQSIFGRENFFLELQPSKTSEEQQFVNKVLVHLGTFKMYIPYIITTDSHYLKKEERPIHEAFLKSQDGEREVMDFYASTYLMSTEEIHEYMDDNIGADAVSRGLANTKIIYDMCENYDLTKPLHIPYVPSDTREPDMELIDKYSDIKLLKQFATSQYDSDRHLARRIVEAIEKDPVERANEEMYNAIDVCLNSLWVSSEKMNTRWSGYLLQTSELVKIAWNEGDTLVGAGRGSGVGFVLLYLLDITQINPLRERTSTFPWRFLNPERASVLDIDIDIQGNKRQSVLKALGEKYNASHKSSDDTEDWNDIRISKVQTLKTEASKSAILTACRGLGIDIDEASYLASFIKAERGIARTLSQTFYGDEENGIEPDKTFVKLMTEDYPKVWEVAQRIEGLVNGVGSHAGGVILVEEPFSEYSALMRTRSGDIITQFDLHQCEDVSMIKWDLLSIEALDKMRVCIDLLLEAGRVENKGSLRETYESIVGVYKIERDNINSWQRLWNHEIWSFFQMEKDSGIKGIALMKPTSVDDLAILNSALRLMAPEKGAEMPLNKLARFKANEMEWDKELKQYGLGEKEKEILKPIVGISYGLCIAQEQFMQLVQLPELGGFSLSWADKLRKSIAKKNPKEYDALTKEFFEITKQKNCNEKLCKYVWNVLIAMSRGYGFNQSHTLAYSIVGLQEMELACKYPVIYWNTANLIVNSGAADGEEENEENDSQDNESESSTESVFCSEELQEEEDELLDTEEDNSQENGAVVKKKKPNKIDYGKIATAIGSMQSAGITIALPDINKSSFTFTPVESENKIYYGIKGILKIGKDLAKDIIRNRPYTSINDFLCKVKVNKPQMVNLIKSGAFDSFGERTEVMKDYILSICGAKTTLNMRNAQKLIEKKLFPEELSFNVKVFNFNKFIKKISKDKGLTDKYYLDPYCFSFYESNFDTENVSIEYENDEPIGYIPSAMWDKMYKKLMQPLSDYIKSHLNDLLIGLNKELFDDFWNKYALGNISKWEMDSVNFYFHDHELKKVPKIIYELEDFKSMPETAEVVNTIPIKGRDIPIYRITRIAGTVIDKNKNKNTVTILTTTGVVDVKIYANQFSIFDKQISVMGADGHKKVIEKSWFSRGNKIIFTGIRRENNFIPKKYKSTPYHLVELITNIDDKGLLTTVTERAEA